LVQSTKSIGENLDVFQMMAAGPFLPGASINVHFLPPPPPPLPKNKNKKKGFSFFFLVFYYFNIGW
jgi:hypothetical protein